MLHAYRSRLDHRGSGAAVFFSLYRKYRTRISFPSSSS